MPWTGIKHQLIREGWLSDGSFEHQAEVWDDTYIPSVGEWESTYNLTYDFVGYQLIRLANLTPPWPGNSNNWVQTGAATVDPRWVISDEQAYPNEPGYQGRWSAMYEFDSEPDSNWLIPFKPDANPFWAEEGWTDEQVESNIWTASYDGGESNFAFPVGGFRPIGLNPPQAKTTFALHVFSDGPCTLEFLRRDWIPEGPEPTFVLDLMTVSQDFPVVADAWSEVRFVTFTDPRIWPNHPDEIGHQDDDIAFGYETIFQSFKLRVRGGSPGQKVWVDNCWIWPDLTTASMPHLTVGVAEWVRDDKGMYVGAHLWFKLGSSAGSSAVVVADEVGQVFPSLVGGDLETASDPYFWVAANQVGNAYEPGMVWDHNGAFFALSQPIIQSAPGSYLLSPPAPNRWVISTVAPFDGTKHLAFVEGGTTATNAGSVGILIANGFLWPIERIYTSRAAEGDSVTFSFRARLEAVTVSARTVSLFIGFYDQNGFAIGTTVSSARVTTTLTASYQLVTFTAVAPGRTYATVLQATISRGSNPTATVGSYYLDAFDYLITPVA